MQDTFSVTWKFPSSNRRVEIIQRHRKLQRLENYFIHTTSHSICQGNNIIYGLKERKG